MQWDTYIDATLFTYRVSCNDSTGFTPFKLVYGRDPVQPDDFLYDPSPAETFDSEEASIKHSSATLAAAYREAYKLQLSRAESNAIRRQQVAQAVDFFPGQHVFYYQRIDPIMESKSNNEPEAPTPMDDARVPNRWKYEWTGPHVIVRRADNKHNIYWVRHNESAKEFQANVNRLRLHPPWSDDVLVSGRDPESDITASSRPWRTDGHVKVGDLFAFRLGDPDFPFGVGKLIKREPDGSLGFQWLSNMADNVRGTFKFGWIDSRDKKYIWNDAPPRNVRRHYSPLTDKHFMDRSITDDDVIVHSFTIPANKKLSPAVLRVISADPATAWDMDA